MGQKFLFALFCLLASSSFAGGLGDASTFGAGIGGDGSLSSGGFGAGDGGGDNSVLGKLKGQGVNFYVGGGLALSMFKGTMTATEGYPDGTPKPVGHKAKINAKLPGAALMFGAQQKGQILTDFGVMAMLSPGTITQKTPGGNGAFTDKNTFKQKYSFTVYGGAGVPLTPAVNVFGKLGLVYTGFDIGYQQVGTTNSGVSTQGVMGVAPGVMLQYKVSETFSTNLDISYAIYQTITTSNLAKSPSGYNYKIKVSPRVLTLMLGGTMTLGSGK